MGVQTEDKAIQALTANEAAKNRYSRSPSFEMRHGGNASEDESTYVFGNHNPMTTPANCEGESCS
jgi:hypothetical protein